MGGTFRHRRPDAGRGRALLNSPAALYALTDPYSSDFHNVTVGGYSTQQGESYLAGPGYDMYSGIGTPIANNLVPDLARETIAPPPTTWTGVYGDGVSWADGLNWSTGLCPTSSTDVVVDSAAVTVNSQDAKANSLELSNTTLDIQSGGTLTVTGTITLNDSSTIEVDSGGKLVCTNTFAAAGAGGSLLIDGGTLTADATATVAAPIMIGPNQATFDTAGYSMALKGQIQNVNTNYPGGLIKTGSGALIIWQPSAAPSSDIVKPNGGTVTLGPPIVDGGSQTENYTHGGQSLNSIGNGNGDNGGDTTGANVVEFYLQPISQGTTNYTTDFEMDSNDNITANNVATNDASGTIYFAVYAGLNQANNTHADNGVGFAFLNFTSTGTIGSEPSSLGLSLENGFGDRVTASPGTSTDLNNDGNLDVGSTNSRSPAGWAVFEQNSCASPRAAARPTAAATARTSCSACSRTTTRMPARPARRRRRLRSIAGPATSWRWPSAISWTAL